ncbi:CubicO group peptidase, beta-lactamase class C family [Chryseobacterium oleae]|uniref:CubicO group peptidase, beta-lactamase class C family n=1 Tax=Chryseobacterium oleae TaxID=491207 RepID=A0A1I4WJ86_CHROL|nr:serine hydrolase domain-containing protein [Chryseobacterium oleae]SFN13323.1 CubicO group peptidase, beta-lactamase class C family [Chryseobacterium oleae]
MKHIVFIILFIFSVTISAQKSTGKYAKELDEYFTALTALRKFNGNVLVSQNGKILLDQSYTMPGKADGLSVSKKSTFIIASVSKVFIKYGILKLAEQGKIKLSDHLNQFIPDFPDGSKISVENLLYHQSGLPREIKDYEKYENVSLEKTIELAKSEKLQFEPGTNTLYSNVGYFILHYIIDKSSEKGYQHFIDNELIKKYQLKNTGEFNSARSVPNFAYGFYNEEGKTVPISQTSINRFETGNYYSTTADLYAFSKKLLSGEHMKKDQALKMFKDSLLIQAGGRPGYRAYYYQNLRSNVTFIFTANFSDMPFQKVTDDIISLLEGKSYSVPKEINKKAITVSDDVLKQYTGQFALDLDPSQTFTVTLENHFLSITDKSGEKTKIYPESQTSFFDAPDSEDGYIFSKKSDGTYDLTIISTGLTLKTTRTK